MLPPNGRRIGNSSLSQFRGCSRVGVQIQWRFSLNRPRPNRAGLETGGSGLERSAGRPGSRRLGGGGRAEVRSGSSDLPGGGRLFRRGDGRRAAAWGGPPSVARRCDRGNELGRTGVS